MNIFPLHPYDAKDRPWVIRLLRYIGYLVVILSTLFGFVALPPVVASTLHIYYASSSDGMYGVAVLLGGVAGFFGGLIISVPYWAIAMLLDDIRAIRTQTSGYASIGGKPGAL